VLVDVVGKQVADVQAEGLVALGLLELRHVDPHVGGGQQCHRVVGQHDRVSGAQGAPGVVRRRVQARRGLVDQQIRPQRVDDLLAPHSPARLQREQLHQGCGRPAAPLLRVHRAAVDDDLEAAQQADAHAHAALPRRLRPQHCRPPQPR
jgi:hypothetical protein